MGDLKVVPMAPLFSVMDGSASDVLGCDGIYVASNGRTLAGLSPPASVSPSSRVNTEQQYRNMRAAAAAADRVAKQLQSQNMDPRRASSLSPDNLKRAFAAAKVPLAQEDKAVGSYTFSQVLAALDYPTWDSRRVSGTGNTGYSYVSPVKDQGGCGTCVAFAATAIAETAVAIANGTAVNKNDFSEQWLFFCHGLYYATCYTGWYMSQAVDVLVRKSIPTEANYPYLSAYDCTLRSKPERRPDGTFGRASYNNIALAKQHIRQWGAVTTYFAVYTDFFDWVPPTYTLGL
ncbi:hypothetical protein GPECTOR_18g12 [Gonium pectorale]|uniref:Peptidase C1A papain C-terminal domain-containing protein n=1 Tax=Gonium pectorale TaxID=33097 RepID=A0A150GJI3_GONPE|nr:hypothetical protein GPECTOR_18g12 [Gonium pectorale]|eukprot:KXZ49962.1 hypothetical protein GPECTOR_18g12 [Gonium pectorale]